MAGPVMSSSSGPKDYFKNTIWDLFEHLPYVDLIMMVRGGGPPFLLFKSSLGHWVDVTGTAVDLRT